MFSFIENYLLMQFLDFGSECASAPVQVDKVAQVKNIFFKHTICEKLKELLMESTPAHFKIKITNVVSSYGQNRIMYAEAIKSHNKHYAVIYEKEALEFVADFCMMVHLYADEEPTPKKKEEILNATNFK